jgi:hypothetical protein
MSSTTPTTGGVVTLSTTDPEIYTSGAASTTTDSCADSSGCNTSTGGLGPQPNGADCNDDADCESMNCYQNMLMMFSVRAECNEDADCVAAGLGTACSVDIGRPSAACSDGPIGSTCNFDKACQSGHCDAAIEVPIPGAAGTIHRRGGGQPAL